jgi:nucleoside-diphosphate-sugar epimerase
MASGDGTMIVGSGMLATAFSRRYEDDPNLLIFASGVSNPRETREEAFARETALLCRTMRRERPLIYFGTCSVDDPALLESPYAIHKKKMEALVRSTSRHAIFRLPTVVGTTRNPHTLTNYLAAKIRSGSPFTVWRHARRNLIDVADVASIVTHLIETGPRDVTVNIARPFSISILEIVEQFESILGRKARYSLVDAGGSYAIDAASCLRAAAEKGIAFDEHYVERLLRKYYGA